MYGNNSYNMPIGLAMALSHNPEAFKAFLNMTNDEQDAITQRARESKTHRELQIMVDNLPNFKKYDSKM